MGLPRIEVEQRATPKHCREKADRYAGGAVRDVLVVPVADAPDGVDAMAEWVAGFVVG